MLRTKWACGVYAAMWLAVGLIASCALSPREDQSRPRFHEAAGADVVLRHFRWDQIHLLQPEYREDGFIIPLSREKLNPAFQALQVRRGLAVVVLNYGYPEPDLRQLIAEWQGILFDHGFKRVVCLEAGEAGRINGLVILEDKVQTSTAPQNNAGS